MVIWASINGATEGRLFPGTGYTVIITGMEYLIIAQTAFYAVFSLAILTLSILLAAALYYLLGIAKHLRKITENADAVSGEAREKLQELLDALTRLPIISFLFNDKRDRDDAKSKPAKGRNSKQ